MYQRKIIEADGLVEITVKSNTEIPRELPNADLIILNQHEGGLEPIENNPDFEFNSPESKRTIEELVNWEKDHGAGNLESAISEEVFHLAAEPFVIYCLRVQIARALCDTNRNPIGRAIHAGRHTHANVIWPTAVDYFKNSEIVKRHLHQFHKNILGIEADYLHKIKYKGRLIDVHTMDSFCRREKCPPDQIEKYIRTGIEAQNNNNGNRRNLNTFSLSNPHINDRFKAELDKANIPHIHGHPYDLPAGHRMEDVFPNIPGLIFDVPKDLIYELPDKNVPPKIFHEDNIRKIAHAAAVAILS